MAQRLLRLCLAALFVISSAVLTASPASAFSDVDSDGLDDGVEDALATRFFPYVWYDNGEDWGCTHPATSWNPGTALARVIPHPNDPSKISVQYNLLYARDCGDAVGLIVGTKFAHNGDVEPFSLTLAPNASCPYGYGAFSLKTFAHYRATGEHSEQRLLGNSCTWGRHAGGSPYVARIYAAENKHANYVSDASCDAGGFHGSDNCSESFWLPFNVVNVGEPHAPRVDELSAHQFPGEYAWSSVPFRGSRGYGDGDAGVIRDKWLDLATMATAHEPPPSTRCNQPATAWYQTPGHNQTINQGQQLLVIAAGVMPDSVAQFKFFRNGGEVTYYQTRWANDNCVINQEYMAINASVFSPGTYQVLAVYEEPVSFGGSVPRMRWLPDLTVVQPPPPPPPPPWEEDPDPCNGLCPLPY